MPPTFSAFIDTAHRMIASKGGEAVVLRATPGAYDPVTQEETTATVEHRFRAIEFPPGRSAEVAVGSLVNRHVIQLIFAQKGQAIRPRPGDAVRWGGHEWNLIWATTYDPAADGAILTEAYCER